MADTPKCTSCFKEESSASNVNLKQCAKCKVTLYCSRECQKADWKEHKKICAKNADGFFASPPSPSSNTRSSVNAPKNLETAIDKPFHRLESKTWLHDRSEEDVYQLLIDTYRLRLEDDYTLEGEADVDSLYGGAPNGLHGFRSFLKKAEAKRGLLPPWWSLKKAKECEKAGMRGGWSSLASAVEKSDIIEHYGDRFMPMQMRMLGEQIYGRGPGGQPGAKMMGVMKMMEVGDIDVSLA